MSKEDLDTDKLLERACLGDGSAMERLLEQNRDRLRRMVTGFRCPAEWEP
jgi:hypothetical protein